MRTLTGLECFLAHSGRYVKPGQRLGFLANQATVGPDYRHALVHLDENLPGLVTALFNPQHGWAGEKQDNMVESDHLIEDGPARRPIYSLYGETRKPTPAMLENIDVLLVDLIDIGTRVYTFAQTLALCLEAAAETGVEIIVLDRPNPIGGQEVEGNILADDCRSFVGLYPVPMRHGLTLGELALLMNQPHKTKLTVVKCENWARGQYFPQTGLPWVYPSPNMPMFETAWVYPGQVLWEGTNVSEARGTARPFNLVGAPFIKAERLHKELLARKLPGFVARPAYFQPTFHKWAGQVCGGLELYPTESKFKPYLTSLTILELILKFWPDEFDLKVPPYEYEFTRRPLDLILGQNDLYDRLRAGESAASLEQAWQPGLEGYLKTRRDFLLY